MSKLKLIAKSLLLILGGIYIVFLINKLIHHFNQDESFYTSFQSLLNYSVYKTETLNFTIEKIFLVIFFLVLGLWISKLLVKNILHKILEKMELDLGAKSAIENLTGYILNFIFVLIALSYANVPLAAFTFLGGAVAIGAGFGSQNLINNFISGIILQLEKPVKVGDYITVESIAGVIDEIGMRSTKIRLTNNTFTVVPNSILLEKNVNNWNLKNNFYRSKISLEFSHKNDAKECEKLLHSVMSEFKGKYVENPEYIIYLAGLSLNGLNFELLFWVNLIPGFDRSKLESQVRMKILEKAKIFNIELSTNEIRISQK